MVVATQNCPIWVPKEEIKEQTRGKGPRYQYQTIFGHDLPYTKVREGRVALNKEKKGLDGV